MASSPSPCASLPTHQYNYKHDVFLSFRGEDTRHGFISHLYSALCRKSITTFLDDELKRGKQISQALLSAIEESMFAVVVFSKGYAFSGWCLDELAKIVECIDTRGQKVIPVFYHVDPSDVRKQTGTFADAFAGHEANFNANMEKVQRWRDALIKAANLSGWATQDCRSESAIVDGIVYCIWKDLQKMWPSPLTGLVGIGPRIKELQTLLFSGSSNNVFILGIWGMGGIGKTTIAKALFGQIKYRFERYCFLENVREASEKRGIETSGEKLLQQVLEERNIRMNMADIHEYFYMLRDINILLVLDDVDDRKQLEYFLLNRHWYGPGSRIIITSRNKQLLNIFADAAYQVKELACSDAFQLFCLHAFKRHDPTDDLRHLSLAVVGYAKGVPLALKVLGSSLFGKGKRDWKSTIKKLEKAPHKEIQDVLRISYSDLDKEQKEIFLWIACLLISWKKGNVIELLDNCGLSTENGLDILVDKSLITITNTINMHDLLKEMGREIVREESDNPSERSWLWNCEDIYKVLNKNSGTKKIKGIKLYTDQMKEVQLQPDSFARMPNLKFLQIIGHSMESKVHLPNGISTLPDELRILCWERYPLESLPTNFNTENLYELSLSNSKIVEVFCEETQDLDKLRKFDLGGSQQLRKISNLSRAPNVKKLNLHGCSSLCDVSSSICHLSNVTRIDFTGCAMLRSIPDLRDLRSLRKLLLSDCSNLNTFPEVPRSIEYLNLRGTAIKDVLSASLEYLDNLVELSMPRCTQLESFPDNIDLKSLERLNFSGCSSLKKFPIISKNLKQLRLDETAITQVPSSVVGLSRLTDLSMMRCNELRILPSTIWKLQSINHLRLEATNPELPETLEEEDEDEDEDHWKPHLKYLDLKDCNLVKLPTDLGRLYSLTVLSLRGNSFKTIPVSIKQLSRLWILDIGDCKSLQYLPELPPNLQERIAFGCTSLETVSAALTRLVIDSNFGHFCNFVDCSKLDHMGWRDLAHAVTRNQHLTDFLSKKNLQEGYQKATSSVSRIYTGSMIPRWLKHQSVGDSISFQLPSSWLNDGFLGFALGVVYEHCGNAECVDPLILYELHIGDNNFSNVLCSYRPSNLSNFGTETKHIILRFDHVSSDEVLANACGSQSCHDVVFFKFHCLRVYSKCEGRCKIKMCGLIPLYAYGEGHNTLPLLPPAEAALDNKRCREDELGRNGRVSEVDEVPPRPKRLKQT